MFDLGASLGTDRIGGGFAAVAHGGDSHRVLRVAISILASIVVLLEPLGSDYINGFLHLPVKIARGGVGHARRRHGARLLWQLFLE